MAEAITNVETLEVRNLKDEMVPHEKLLEVVINPNNPDQKVKMRTNLPNKVTQAIVELMKVNTNIFA